MADFRRPYFIITNINVFYQNKNVKGFLNNRVFGLRLHSSAVSTVAGLNARVPAGDIVVDRNASDIR